MSRMLLLLNSNNVSDPEASLDTKTASYPSSTVTEDGKNRTSSAPKWLSQVVTAVFWNCLLVAYAW